MDRCDVVTGKKKSTQKLVDVNGVNPKTIVRTSKAEK